MERLPIGPLHYEFSRHNQPRIKVEDGATIVVETEDALSGQIRTSDDRRDKRTKPFSNPLTGPIWIEGAEPGDSLAVTVGAIRPLHGRCVTRTADPRQLAEWLGTDCPHGTRVCPIRDGRVFWTERLTIPYAPMLGCVGTAPDWGVPSTLPAGPYGGNMDIIETCPGNTVVLPVFVPGALLYVGDAHAAMGHGELSATGLEMAAETELTVSLRKGARVPGPRIETPDEIMTVASGPPMGRAIAQAFAHLILWMEADFGWDRWHAYDILTHVARISVGYYGIGTVATKISREYLDSR